MTTEDELVMSYISAAVGWVENWTERSLMTQTHQVSLCDFPYRLWLPRAAPLVSITFVKYYDAANVQQTLASSVYTVPAFAEPACVRLASGQVWPVVYDREDAVQIEYIAGASTQSSVLAELRQAVQFLTGHFFQTREPIVIGTISGDVALTVHALCAPHRLSYQRVEWEAA